MNKQQFSEAIRSLNGFDHLILSYLIEELSPSLSDELRKEAFDELSSLHNDLVQKQGEATHVYKEGAEKLKQFMKEKFPLIRKKEEAAQKKNKNDRLETMFQNS